MLRIAVIGAGRIGKIHSGNVARHPRCRLVAVVDPVESAAKALAAEHDAQWASDAADLLAGKDIDAIVVGSPTSTHIDLIDRAAGNGKAVLCEKPIDLDIAKVNRCLEEASKTTMKGILGYEKGELVSMDFRGDDRSSIVDAPMTTVVAGNCVKVISWYDNEWGYSCRVRDLISFMAKKGL